MRRGGGPGAVEVKGKKSEPGGVRSQGLLAPAVGSVGSPVVPLGQGIHVHPDGAEWVRAESGSRSSGALRAPQVVLTFSPVSPMAPVSPWSP